MGPGVGMTWAEIVERTRGGRTDLVFDLLRQPGWREALHEGPVHPLQWFGKACDFLLEQGADAIERNTGDHGAGWGNGLERDLLGDCLPASVPRR